MDESQHLGETDYLIVFVDKFLQGVGKIREIVLPKSRGNAYIVRISEFRDLHNHPRDENFYELFEEQYYNHSNFNGLGFFLTSFNSDGFFSIGNPVKFRALPGTPMFWDIDQAATAVAKSYGVDNDQVTITITSKVTPKSLPEKPDSDQE